MDNQETNEGKNALDKDKKATAQLVRHFESIKLLLDAYNKEVRASLLNEIKLKLEKKLNDEKIRAELASNTHYLKCDYENVAFLLEIQQKYPDYDEGGRGLWWGVYDTNEATFAFTREFELENGRWESVYFKGLSDFSADTDKGSAIIIESIDNLSLREEIISEIVDKIVAKSGQIAKLIYQKHTQQLL